MAVPGVRMVQSASRPDGKVPEQATLSYQAGTLGRQFNETIDSLTQRLSRISELDSALAQTQAAVNQLGSGLRGGSAGLADTVRRPQPICAPAWMACNARSRRCRATWTRYGTSSPEPRIAPSIRCARR